MFKEFNFRQWLGLKEKTFSRLEDDKNARQFEAAGDFMAHRTVVPSYERYYEKKRVKGKRTPRMDLSEKKNT